MDAKNIKLNLNNATYEQTKEIPIFIEKEIFKNKSRKYYILHCNTLLVCWASNEKVKDKLNYPKPICVFLC